MVTNEMKKESYEAEESVEKVDAVDTAKENLTLLLITKQLFPKSSKKRLQLSLNRS